MPLYWNLLVAIPSVELATHRILWCAICVFAISALRGRLPHLIQIVRNPKLLRTLMLTSVLITCNWTIFIYCVESHQLVAASLGYYITPALVGGAADQMISYFIAFYTSDSVNWGMASALGAVLLIATLLLYWVYDRLVGITNVKLG